jgi:beta-glucosidase
MRNLFRTGLGLCCMLLLIGAGECDKTWPTVESEIKKDPKIENKIKAILATMTLEEKVGQMVQAEIKHATPADVKKYHLGSVLNGGGSFPGDNKYAKVSDWLKLADAYFEASVDKTSGRTAIPVIWGTDAVHGHNNVFGATIFPHNIGLGAMNNTKLLEEIGKITAQDVLATGIDWIFAPTVAVVRNDRWGRAYEGYSEDPELVKKYAGPMVHGLQGKGAAALGEDHVIATVKHFIGDGGTFNGIDQGDNRSTEKELFEIHGQGYVTGLAAGAQTVMASFNSWQGKKVHGEHYLLTEVLKNKMGFDGFVIGDWNGHGQVDGCSNDSCAKSINAGVDMLMAPQDWKKLITNTINDVKQGKITIQRIDDAVTRILRVKMRAGMFKKKKPSLRKHANKPVGTQRHREVARQAVRESLVLLKNKNKILPLDPNSKVLVTGSAANDIGRQSGGWTLTWQGTGNQNSDFPGATSIYDGIKEATGGKAYLSENGVYKTKPDVAIVVFGETPYAEGQGDISDLYYNYRFSQDLALLRKLKSQGIPVVSIFITGRPLWINPELNASDAFVVAWLPGSEGNGVSDVLFTDFKGNIRFDFKGKLSFSWPLNAAQAELNRDDKDYKPLFAYGYGLTLSDTDTLGDELSENPFPGGSIPVPADKVTVFKGRTYSPFVSYAGDAGNWKLPLGADRGYSANRLVKVTAIDKDVQEDARKLTFYGGDSNFYFQSDRNMDLSSYVNTGVLKLDIRIDKKPDNEANILMGLGMVNFNHYLNVEKLKEWKTVGIELSCFKNNGTDFKNFNMPLSFATFGSMELSVANIEILKEQTDNLSLYQCPAK